MRTEAQNEPQGGTHVRQSKILLSQAERKLLQQRNDGYFGEYGTLTNQALAIFPVRMTGAFSIFRRICLLNVFEAVKQSVTTRQAAEHYGILVPSRRMFLSVKVQKSSICSLTSE